MQQRPMNYPDPNECPSSIAEHIYDIRVRKNTEATTKAIKSRYGTWEFFFLAVESVYEANSWVLSKQDKATFKKVFV